MQLSKVARCVLTDSAALILLILIGFIAAVWHNVPAALTFIQAVGVELLVMALPLSVLAKNKGPHKPRHDNSHQALAEVVMYGALAAGLAYANYRLFFASQNLEPAYIDKANPVYIQANTLAFVTVAFSQLINLLYIRSDTRRHFFTGYLWRNQKLVRAFGISVFLMLNVVYNPFLQFIFNTGPLSVAAWLLAAVAATLYVGLRQLQRHSRQHTRHAVIKLHREIHKHKLDVKL